MLPRELPISDVAVEAAARANHDAEHEREALCRGFDDCPVKDEYLKDERVAIQAFLQVEGFEVEDDYKSLGGCFVRETRLVSPWKPAPSSTEGGEG